MHDLSSTPTVAQERVMRERGLLGKLWRAVVILVRVGVITLLVWLLVVSGLIWGVHTYPQTDRAADADVIIVLGAGLNRNSQPGPALTRRSAHGAALWRAGYAPAILCTGGQASFATRSEADACRELLLRIGVPAAAIAVEERSRSTEENAYYAQQIMTERGWRSAVVVSDGYHLLRARWLFEIAGIEAVDSPAPFDQSNGLYRYSVLREVAAMHWQIVKTILGLPQTYVPWF